MEKVERVFSLSDVGFQNYSKEEKRIIFLILDQAMKELHNKHYMVTSFNPKDIYYDPQNKICNFSKTEKMSPMNVSDENDAILNNIISLADLAFCSYLPIYDINQGLLNSEVVSKYYEKFENNFIPMDRGYYRSVLVDSIRTRKLPEVAYFYDYVKQVMKNANTSNSNNSNVRSFIKATEVGKLMTEGNEEAAFSTVFYLTCMVSATLIALVGIILYFLK